MSGNRLYEAALAEKDEIDKALGLLHAFSCYKEALELSSTDDDEVSALETVATASMRLVTLHYAAFSSEV